MEITHHNNENRVLGQLTSSAQRLELVENEMRFILPFICCFFICIGSSDAGDAVWKVGLGRVKITPQMPVFLSGYASRDKPFTTVESELYVKALALEDEKKTRLIIVTSDLLGFPAEVAEPICATLQKKLGLKRGQILLNSSHTHTGPMVSLNPKVRGNLSAGDAQRTIVYTQSLQKKVVEAVERAVADMQPASLSVGTGVVSFVMNRREFTPRGVILGVNPRGLVDRSVPVMRIDDAKGKMIAVLFGAACHNTTLTGRDFFVCGDYAGFAQEYLEKRYPNVQTMFMLGCAGDANPYPRGTLEISKRHGKTLADETARVLQTKLRPVRGPIRIAFDQVNVPLQAPMSRKELESFVKTKRGAHRWVAERMLKILDRGEKLPSHYSCPLSVVRFDSDLTLVGLPGEVVVDYVPLLEKALGPNKLWIAAYCNDVFGYLPSKRVLREGGYETRGLYSGGVGFFAPEAEDVVVSAVRRLAKDVGRVK